MKRGGYIMDLPSLPTEAKTRRYTSQFVVAAILLVGWAVVATQDQIEYINQLAKDDPAAATGEFIWLTRVVACALGVGTVAIGAWVWWLGHRLRQTGCFQLPEIDLLHPKRIGAPNTTDIGRAAQAIGLIIILLGIATAWLLVQLAHMLLQQ